MIACPDLDAAEQIKASRVMPSDAIRARDLPEKRSLLEQDATDDRKTHNNLQLQQQQQQHKQERQSLGEFVSEFTRILSADALAAPSAALPANHIRLIVHVDWQGWCLVDPRTHQPRFGRNVFARFDDTAETRSAHRAESLHQALAYLVEHVNTQEAQKLMDKEPRRKKNHAASSSNTTITCEVWLSKTLKPLVALEEASTRWLIDTLFSDEASNNTSKSSIKHAHRAQAFVRRYIVSRPQRRIQLRFKFQEERDNRLLRLVQEFMVFNIRELEQVDAAQRAYAAGGGGSGFGVVQDLVAAPAPVIAPPSSIFGDYLNWLKSLAPSPNEQIEVRLPSTGEPFCTVHRRRSPEAKCKWSVLCQLPSIGVRNLLEELNLDAAQMAMAVDLLTLNRGLAWCLLLPIQFRKCVRVRLPKTSRLQDALAHLALHQADDLFSRLPKSAPADDDDASPHIGTFCSLFATDLLLLTHNLAALQAQPLTVSKT